MAQSDDEIPDLFPAARRPGQAAAPSPAPIQRPASAQRAEPAQRPGPAPRPSQAPPHVSLQVRPSRPPVSHNVVEPPPLRIKDSPSSDGFVVDFDHNSQAPDRGTVVVGTPDDALEFDPTSIRRPTAEEYLLTQPAPVSTAPPAELNFPSAELELESPGFELEPSPSTAPPAYSPSTAPSAYSSSAAPPVSGFPRSSAAPSSSVRPAASAFPQGQRVSHYPPANAELRSSMPPQSRVPANLGMNFPGLGGEVELGDGLDDLGLGGAGLAQLNVAIPMHEADDVPWPLARTPHADEIDLSDEEIVALSGFGPAPGGVLSAPMYFLRVFLALKPLKQICRATEHQFREAERARDAKLARVAELKRPLLQKNDRFRALYSTIDRHDQNIIARRQALDAADADGADELRRVQAKLEVLSVERTLKESRRDEQKRTFEQRERQLERARATLRRTEIELRNLEERKKQGVDFGVVDFETRKDAQLREQAQARDFLDSASSERRQFERNLEQAEDDLRRVVADFQAHEAQKDGLLIAYEGDLSDRSRELDEAIWGRLNELAHAARVIFELRGEVKVDAEVRLEIAAADQEVRSAFIDYERARAALGSMDVEMYRTGRMMWALFGLIVIAALIASAVL